MKMFVLNLMRLSLNLKSIFAGDANYFAKIKSVNQLKFP